MVLKMNIHPNYTGSNNDYQNDICILHLEEPFTLGIDVERIQLRKNESELEGTECVVSGWGSKKVSNSNIM